MVAGGALVGLDKSRAVGWSLSSQAAGAGSLGWPQPCMSRAMRPTPWIARTTKTAIFTRARPLFFCSKKEPCGISGLSFGFILVTLIAHLVMVVLLYDCFLRGFPSKKPEAKVELFSVCSCMTVEKH